MSDTDTEADAARRDHEDAPRLPASSQEGHFIKWKRANGHAAALNEARYLLLGLVSLATATGLCFWLNVPLVSAAFTYLIVIVLLSLVANLSSLIVFSFVGIGCLSYFFAPPIYSFRVDYPQDLITLLGFLITSIVVNLLVTRVLDEQRGHMRTCETLRDANEKVEVANKGLRIENAERKRAEQALRESEYKLRQTVDTVPGLIWSTCPDGEPTHVSQRLLDYSGMRLEDFKHVGWKAFVHPDDVSEAVRAYSHAIQSGASYRGVLRLRRADGEFRWHHARCEPLRDGQGRIIQWYGLSVDIDEGKKTEEWPRFLAQLQAILNVLPAYTWYAAPSGALTFVNKRTADYLGVPKDHPLRFGIDIGAQWDDWIPLLHPDDQDGSRRYWSNLLRTGEAGEHSYRVRGAQGDYRWFLTRIEPLRASDGTLLLWIGETLDIEELKGAEQALRESEGKIRRLVDANIIGIFIWDFDGRILEANEAFLGILGYEHEDLAAGRIRWTDLTPSEWRDRDTRLIQEHKVTGTLHPFEKEYFRKDGTRVPVLIGVATFEESGNQGVAFVLDLTERKRVEERLRVQHLVAHILAEAAGIEEASPRILRAMGECLGWDVGVLWRVDREAEALRCVELWHKASMEVPEFESVSRELTFVPGLGLPGRVWCSLEPEYISDVVADDNFPRAPIAEQEGLHAALGFPILLGGEVLGVIEFFSREIRQPDRELLNVLAAIGSQIGQFIERRRAEQALRESEAKFRDYAETASDWFCEVDPDYKFTMLSENAFRSGAADRIGTPCWDQALDLETEPEKWRLLQETIASRKPFRDFVYRAMSGDGLPMYVRASGKPLFDANGEFRGYRGACSDVTEIMRSQEALRESERSLRSAIDGIAGLVAVMAPNGELDAINLQVIEYFGRSLEEMKSWGTSDAVHPEDLPRIAEIFQRSIVTGTPFQYELRLRRFDGEYRWFDNRAVPISEKSGRIVRWYILGTDIEERTRALARLQQMQSEIAHMSRVSMMGELAASLSHEITQPIGSARNNAQAALNFLDRQPPELGEVREGLACVVDDADRAGEIIERIRDHIRKAPPQKTNFDLNRAIDEVILLGRSAITKKEVLVRTRLTEGLFPVQGDRVQLQQVILNLVLNAVEAMGAVETGPREVLISTEPGETNGVLVAVRDSGPGIDPADFERVFEAFYTTKSRGVGMGLSICRSIIDAHGGRLWAKANEPRGAVFQFTLPGVEK